MYNVLICKLEPYNGLTLSGLWQWSSASGCWNYFFPCFPYFKECWRGNFKWRYILRFMLLLLIAPSIVSVWASNCSIFYVFLFPMYFITFHLVDRISEVLPERRPIWGAWECKPAGRFAEWTCHERSKF